MKTKRVKSKIIINDPVHKVMDFGSENKFRTTLKDVVDTSSFQRLRRVSQLGLASFVFPGATHTRFSHSLGAAFLASKVCEHLIEQEDLKTSKEVKGLHRSIVISALLHDVGHGPFSHSFENVLKGLIKDRNLSLNIPMHEDWTAEIIKNKKFEIHLALTKNGLDPELVSSPFYKKSLKTYPSYLKQIVSSQIDVDRMDYLIRDSHFAGVSLGEIDLHYLINCLHVVRHGKSKPMTLGITNKGVKPYEAYVIARQLMNRSVYYHKKVKVIENMVETIFRFILDEFKSLNKKQSTKSHIPDYFINLNDLLNSDTKIDIKSFLADSLHSYLNLTEDNFWVLAKLLASEKYGLISDLSKMLLKREVWESVIIKSGKHGIAEELLTSSKFKKNIDFLIVELESTLYKEKSDSDKVFVIGSMGSIDDVSMHSQLISAFKDKPEFEKILIIKNCKKIDQIKLILKKADVAVF